MMHPSQLRRTHYLDIENLCRSSLPSSTEVALAADSYAAVLCGIEGERCFVASSHKSAYCVASTLGLSGGQLLQGSGPNGADLALLAVIEDDVRSGRSGHVVIGSGDYIFAEHLAGLRSSIARLTFVVPRGGGSWRCWEVGDEVITIEPTSMLEPRLAVAG
jgi:hypothetical protein